VATSNHRARRSRPISLLLTASAVGAAVLGALLLSGGTYALWAQGSTVPNVTVSAGTLSLSASSSFTASLWQKLAPGETVRQSFTVSNTGTIPATISATAATGSGAFQVRLVTGACPASALSGPSATVVATALGTIAASSSMTVCLEVAVTTSAVPGDLSTFSVSLTGTQSH
jgi:predicted ribosomally synthesized peptide with SipW-like signal peptide